MSTPPITAAPDYSSAMQPLIDLQIALAGTIQAHVKASDGATAVNSYSSSLNASTSMLTVDINVQGPNGPIDISTTISIIGGVGFGAAPFGEEFGI